MFIPKKTVWKLKEQHSNESFHSERKRVKKEDNTSDVNNVESQWTASKEDLLRAADKVCGWTSSPVRQSKLVMEYSNEADNAIQIKHKLLRAWKKGGDKGGILYLEAKCRAIRVVYRLSRGRGRHWLENCIVDGRSEKFSYRYMVGGGVCKTTKGISL